MWYSISQSLLSREQKEEEKKESILDLATSGRVDLFWGVD
jgi:hypothetical protein